MNPQQEQLLQQLLSGLNNQNMDLSQNPLYQQGSNYLSELLRNDQASFDRFASPYKRQFERETIPGIAEKFGNAGLGSSSALNTALGSAANDFSTNLASLRSNLQQGAASQALGYAQQPISNAQSLATSALGFKPFETLQTEGSEGVLNSILGALIPGLGLGLGKAGARGITSGINALGPFLKQFFSKSSKGTGALPNYGMDTSIWNSGSVS